MGAVVNKQLVSGVHSPQKSVNKVSYRYLHTESLNVTCSIGLYTSTEVTTALNSTSGSPSSEIHVLLSTVQGPGSMPGSGYISDEMYVKYVCVVQNPVPVCPRNRNKEYKGDIEAKANLCVTGREVC